MKNRILRLYIRNKRNAALLCLCAISFVACTSKPVDKTPPKGALEHSVSDDGKFAATMFNDKLVFQHEGKKEMEISISDFDGMNFSPGGVVLFTRAGKRKVFTYRDYDPPTAKRIVQRLTDSDWGQDEMPGDDEEEVDDDELAEEDEE